MFGLDLLIVGPIALLLIGGSMAAFLVMRNLDRIPMAELGDPEEINQAAGRAPKTPPPTSVAPPGSTRETQEKIKNLHWSATCNVLQRLGVAKAPGMLRSMSEHTLDPVVRARWLAQVLGHDPDAVFADKALGTPVRTDFLIETEKHCVMEDFLDSDPKAYASLKLAIERQMARGHHDFRRKVAEGAIQLRDAETAIKIVYEFDASPEKLRRVSVLQTALNAAKKRYMQQRSRRQAKRSLRTAVACRAEALLLLDILERLADADGKWMASRNALENMPEAGRSEALSQTYQNARASLYRRGASLEDLQGLIGDVEKIAGDMEALAVRAGVPPAPPTTPPGGRSVPEIWKLFGLTVAAGKHPTLDEARQAYTRKFIQSVAERDSATDDLEKERAAERTRILQENWERARAFLTSPAVNIVV